MGFARVPDWVLEADISDRALRLFAVLAKAGNREGQCYLSKETIAARTRCDRGSLPRLMRQLVKVGALRVTPRAGRRSSYTVRQVRPAQIPEQLSLDDLAPQGHPTRRPRATPPAPQGHPHTSSTKDLPIEIHASHVREADEGFEVLAEKTGYDPHELTRTARGELNRALADIRFVAGDLNGRLPEEISRRAAHYVRAHPGWELTPSALAKWWPTLGQVRAPPQQQRFESAATTWLRARAEEVRGDGSEGGDGPSIAARPSLPGPLD